VLLRNTELNGRLVDVRLGRTIREIGQSLAPADEPVWDAAGGAVLPGLHDHHLHFNALAARAYSVDLQLTEIDRLTTAGEGGWLRGVGYHEAQHGELDRQRLDAWVADRPVRLQHSSGKMWVLNSLACELLGIADAIHPGIERDAAGRLTGRLFRMDQWLADRLAPLDLDAHRLAAQLAAFGITGITDASFTNSSASLDRLRSLPLKVWAMGDETISPGQLKVMLDEDQLPDLDSLITRVEQTHKNNRGVAFHAVTRIEVVTAIAVLEAAGSHEHDRLEHGALIAPDLFARLGALGITVVTQPGFIADRGDRYLAEVATEQHADLYRYQSLLDAGIPVAASSDAPYGPLNPWQIMDAATRRTTAAECVLGRRECVAPMEALRGYLSSPNAPGGRARSIEVGDVADLCILQQSIEGALSQLDKVTVQATLIEGAFVYSSR
jgi:predicted amidohydrolase YtcJ